MTNEFHAVNVVDHKIDVTKRPDGTTLVKTVTNLPSYAIRITDKLEHWAKEKPDHVFLAQRTKDHHHWCELSYSDVLEKVKACATFLLSQNLSPERPLAILSGNSIEHQIIGLAAMYVGIPYSPISTAYSLISKDFGKLRHIVDTMTPGLVFVDNLGPYRDAIDSVCAKDCQIVSVESEHGLDDLKHTHTPFADILKTVPNAALEEANAQVNADTIAKFLFTSGSTGMPKGVINTQRMICSNQEMLRSVLAFLKDEPPVICDWLPWNHTFGGNHNVGIILYNGGSLYIDEGKPVPKAIETTLENLAEIAPTIYFNVPKGYEFLAKEFKKCPDIAKNFFSKLQVMYFAGAGLSQHVWDQLDALSIEHTGKKVPMMSGLGSTETAPAALFASIAECASGVVGVPAPAVELKLVPNQGKQEVRIKGPSITPGYWRSPDLTKKAYDEEGFYCLGDALKFIDPDAPNRGFYFDGRVSEDFKLDTGTWVSVGTIRPNLIHYFAPYIQDVVIVGRDKGFISALIFPDMHHCRELLDDQGEGLSDEQVINTIEVRQVFSDLLHSLAQKSSGSSNRIKRVCILSIPAQLDAHEMTDKGSLNQNAVIENRQTEVSDLYSSQPSERVISL